MSKLWATKPEEIVQIRLGSKGYDSLPPVSVLDVLHKTVNKFGKEKALAVKRQAQVSSKILFIVYSC